MLSTYIHIITHFLYNVCYLCEYFMFCLQNDTMRVIYMYHESEPQRGLLIPGNLPNPEVAFRGYRSLFLTQKPQQHQNVDPNMKIMELRNQDVELPQGMCTFNRNIKPSILYKFLFNRRRHTILVQNV